jgi:Ca2+-binding EF-hand superfamily protein
MKSQFITGLCIILVIILATPAFASYFKGIPVVPNSVFQALDAQNLSKSEIKTQRQNIFNEMDVKKDGKISKDEFMLYEKNIFAGLDRKNDAALTPDEINKTCKSYFLCLDANKDNKVTVQELNAKLDETFKLMDGKDQDGYITNEEYFSYWKDWDKANASEQTR